MSEPESASIDTRRRRLLYRATHRGTYENDILLGGFVKRHISAMRESELAALEALLELPENATDLYPGMFVKASFVTGETDRKERG